jgi:hypothetical protein
MRDVVILNFDVFKGFVASKCSNNLPDGSRDPLIDHMTKAEQTADLFGADF